LRARRGTLSPDDAAAFTKKALAAKKRVFPAS
jgi:hypothetical protein